MLQNFDERAERRRIDKFHLAALEYDVRGCIIMIDKIFVQFVGIPGINFARKFYYKLGSFFYNLKFLHNFLHMCSQLHIYCNTYNTVFKRIFAKYLPKPRFRPIP